MVRKINPVDLRNDFGAGIDELLAFYDRLKIGQLKKDESLLAESVILSTAVLWEGFVNDLIIAYINRDSARFNTHMDDALKGSLTAKQKAILDSFGSMSYPAHLKKDEIGSILDDKGNNVTFSHFSDLEDRTQSWVVPALHARISGRSNLEKTTVNVMIAVRNHIAHRSQRSYDAMNAGLNEGVLHPSGLRRGANAVSNVGSYFKSVPVGHQRSRVHILLEAIKGIAANM